MEFEVRGELDNRKNVIMVYGESDMDAQAVRSRHESQREADIR